MGNDAIVLAIHPSVPVCYTPGQKGKPDNAVTSIGRIAKDF
jgi:hypothetical protein